MCINISLTLSFTTTTSSTTKHFHCVGDVVGEGRGSVADAERSTLSRDPFARCGGGNTGARARISHSGTRSGRAAGPKPGPRGPARSPAEFFQIAIHIHIPLSPLAGAAGLHSERCPGPWEWKSLP